jgi:hypothetical protein
MRDLKGDLCELQAVLPLNCLRSVFPLPYQVGAFLQDCSQVGKCVSVRVCVLERFVRFDK